MVISVASDILNLCKVCPLEKVSQFAFMVNKLTKNYFQQFFAGLMRFDAVGDAIVVSAREAQHVWFVLASDVCYVPHIHRN